MICRLDHNDLTDIVKIIILLIQQWAKPAAPVKVKRSMSMASSTSRATNEETASPMMQSLVLPSKRISYQVVDSEPSNQMYCPYYY